MKIICEDNFDREGPGFDDILICENITLFSDDIIKFLNSRAHTHSNRFFKVVPDNYKLKQFIP